MAGRPDPVVQGAPRRGGGAGRRTRHRGGARRPDPAGRHDHGDPRRVRHRHRRARRSVEADDVLGTLAARERTRPGRRGQRRPRPAAAGVATSRCRSGCSTWAAGWPRRRSAGPAEVAETLRRAGRPRRPRLRRTGAAARRSVRRAARCARRRREDGGDAAGPARLAGGHPGRRRTTRNRRCRKAYRTKLLRRDRLHRGGRAGGAGGHRRRRQLLDAVRRAAAGAPSTRARSPNSPQHTA